MPKPERESSIEDYLKDRVEAMGGGIRKLQFVGHKGAPDRLVGVPSINLQCLVEVKRPGGLAKFPDDARERRQWREHRDLRLLGFRVEVIDSREGVDRLLA